MKPTYILFAAVAVETVDLTITFLLIIEWIVLCRKTYRLISKFNRLSICSRKTYYAWNVHSHADDVNNYTVTQDYALWLSIITGWWYTKRCFPRESENNNNKIVYATERNVKAHISL